MKSGSRRFAIAFMSFVVSISAACEAAAQSPPLQHKQTQTMDSAAFERFRFSFFEDPYSARDGLDTTALAQLEGGERNKAEDMLIRYLPDSRGVIGLGLLRSQSAEPALVALSEDELRQQGESGGDWYPNALIYLAKALWQIRPDPRWSAALIEVLRSAPDAVHRWDAAHALYEVRGPAATPALIAALDDLESLVRYHAARALLADHGLAADSLDREHMMYRVMSDDAARRDGGKRDILAAIAGRQMAAP
jgi:HEAT repeats